MNFDNVIILEDDVVLCEDWYERLDSLFFLLSDCVWEHVYLSGHSDYVNFEIFKNPTLSKAPKMVGAFSYMVNKPAYSKLSRFTSSLLTTFDDMVMYMIEQEKLKSYVYFPFMTFHNATESSVWNGENPGHLAHENNMHSSYKYFKNKIDGL
jgi:GR25 family glycosyltransferase involved in LPS biosynthesis